ncbi:MAG: hypothetical protein INQ03_13625 [Candidatus Heimdallarchaeota archaeon]|nr:hypothetical protein [Candidatus Heimdallarchaeota archaeon]
MDTESQEEYDDIITYHPSLLHIYSRDTLPILKGYWEIVKGLKNETEMLYLTAKEIHDLYLEKGKHKKSLKTVYKYIKELRDVDVLVEAGRRVTKNKRNTEFLYCLKSEMMLFEDAPVEERFWSNEEKVEGYVNKVIPLIESQLEGKRINKDKYKEFIRNYRHHLETISDNIVKDAEHNEVIANVYRSIQSDKREHKVLMISEAAALIVILLKHRDIIEDLEYLTDD